MPPLDLDTTQPGYWDALFVSPDAVREEAERRIKAATAHIVDQVADDIMGIANTGSDDGLRAMLVDWEAFWQVDHTEADWIAEPVIAAKRSTALFAPGGTGKSLLSLYIAVHLATGSDPFSRRKRDPINVLYLDYEMTNADLAERLEGMGFEGAKPSHLHYALLPSLPGLDEPEGGKAVVRLAQICEAELVVIDTFGRAVHGDENDADTVRAWYRWTGLHLKHEGRAFLRVDHAGKDLAKGQRGTSAKNDDVDVVWQMTRKEGNAYALIAKKRRMGWVPERVDLTLIDSGRLAFGLLDDNTYPVGTVDVAKNLDALGAPIDVSARAAQKMLADAGKGARSAVVRGAVKYRKMRSNTYHLVGDKPAPPDPYEGMHPAVAEVEKATREEAGWTRKSASQTPGRGDEFDDWDAERDAASLAHIDALVDELGRGAGRDGTR